MNFLQIEFLKDREAIKGWLMKPMVTAFIISILIHISCYSAYVQLKKLNLKSQAVIFQKIFPTSKLRFDPAKAIFGDLIKLPSINQKTIQNLTIKPQEPPMVFVSVPPLVSSETPPEKPKFYSDKNSKAANPKMDKESDKPKIDGVQDKVVQLVDVQKPTPTPPKPEPPKVEEKKPQPKPPEPKPQPKTEPKPEPDIKQLALAKQAQKPTPELKPGDKQHGTPSKETTPSQQTKYESLMPSGDSGSQTQTRPRTLAEARARQGDGQIAGQKYRQEGGVHRKMDVASVDAAATPFGNYDAGVFAAIQKRWYDLLDQSQFAADRRGKVVITFRLHSNGRISNLKIQESNVGEVLTIICRMAIEDPAPFDPWPADLRRIIEKDYREIMITFHYL
jgi:outer membrane biosynthesis protein TonB